MLKGPISQRLSIEVERFGTINTNSANMHNLPKHCPGWSSGGLPFRQQTELQMGLVFVWIEVRFWILYAPHWSMQASSESTATLTSSVESEAAWPGDVKAASQYLRNIMGSAEDPVVYKVSFEDGQSRYKVDGPEVPVLAIAEVVKDGLADNVEVLRRVVLAGEAEKPLAAGAIVLVVLMLPALPAWLWSTTFVSCLFASLAPSPPPTAAPTINRPMIVPNIVQNFQAIHPHIRPPLLALACARALTRSPRLFPRFQRRVLSIHDLFL